MRNPRESKRGTQRLNAAILQAVHAAAGSCRNWQRVVGKSGPAPTGPGAGSQFAAFSHIGNKKELCIARDSRRTLLFDVSGELGDVSTVKSSCSQRGSVNAELVLHLGRGRPRKLPADLHGVRLAQAELRGIVCFVAFPACIDFGISRSSPR